MNINNQFYPQKTNSKKKIIIISIIGVIWLGAVLYGTYKYFKKGSDGATDTTNEPTQTTSSGKNKTNKYMKKNPSPKELYEEIKKTTRKRSKRKRTKRKRRGRTS